MPLGFDDRFREGGESKRLQGEGSQAGSREAERERRTVHFHQPGLQYPQATRRGRWGCVRACVRACVCVCVCVCTRACERAQEGGGPGDHSFQFFQEKKV